MKPFITFLCLLYLPFSMFASNGNKGPLRCQDAHIGTFEVHYKEMKILMKRDKDFQYEYVNGGSIKYKVKWITECSYTLELISTDIQDVKQYIGNHYTTTINSIERNEFHYTCVLEKDNMSIDGYMIKTKD